ncbi:phospholipid phosphatase-related protein type 5 [Fukomys damarensis]|uniref:phospholipid phosphatase-related protein type 5 n=1 Tax=Fukomys damarensis TaxID=885580 RepID=UPI00053FF104|nr:phospholipid phosphatase-related protein type 5 [Fukomys damarensis]
MEEMVAFEVCVKEEVEVTLELGHRRNSVMNKPMQAENADSTLKIGRAVPSKAYFHEKESVTQSIMVDPLNIYFHNVKIIVGETAVFCLQLATRDFENQEKTILTGDCCYINPLVRRTVRFLGIYTFGLFATDIFVNAGQVVTGNLAPHFLALCKPNYTALGCQQYTQFISGEEACTGNPDLIMRARKTFPSKEAALSVYAAMYLTMYITNTIKAKGTRLAKPVLCLGLMCLAFLTGLNRVAEYRNHWSDVIAGFLVGISIAVFLVVCVVNNFKGRQPESEHIHMDNLAQMPMISIPRVERPLEKVTYLQLTPSIIAMPVQLLRTTSRPSRKSHDIEADGFSPHWTSSLFTIHS